MTTLLSSESAVPALQSLAQRPAAKTVAQETSKRRHTLASSLAFLTVCVAVVIPTFAFGTVHFWALAVFAATAAGLVCLWCLDGLTLRSVQLSRNALQLPLLGLIILGLIQLLPLRSAADNGGLSLSLSRALSLDPNSTRLILVQLVSLLIFFTATLTFTDSPRRLRARTRTIIV